MSAETRDRLGSLSADRTPGARALALSSILVLTGAYLSVLYHVTDVVGGRTAFLGIAAGAFLLATLFGRFLGVRVAALVAVGLLVGGFGLYVFSLPRSQLELLTPGRILADTVALLTGLSVLRLTGASVWAMAITPGPVFLSWYLALRRRYVAAVAVGGVALSLFVLTGDAGQLTTLVGVVGGTVAVAAATFERYGAGVAQVDVMTILLAAMIVSAATVSVVPGAEGAPLLPNRGSPTMEANLVDAQDRIGVVGSIRLSPKVRFTVNSSEPSYWETAAYDRYTGDGWVRTGSTDPYSGRLRGPPGASRTVEQTVTAKDTISILPAAWRPVELDGDVASDAEVTQQGNLRPTRSLDSGEQYTVTSQMPLYTTEELRRSGTDYPEVIEEQYLQLPDSTPNRVRQKADEIAGDEDNPYDKARAIEAYLEENKRYSLSVSQPSGNTADAFLFEMDAGYCVYYATTMVVLLRSEGVPARFVTGYTPGERTGEGQYVVRGLDAHAWVEVYFEDVGWVRFDPTPSTPRETAESTRLTEARQNGEEGVDTEATERTATPTPTEVPATTDTDAAPGDASDSETPTPTVAEDDENAGGVTPSPDAVPGVETSTTEPGGNSPIPSLPPGRTFALGLVALAGLVAGARRTGVAGRAYRLVWLRYQGAHDDPSEDAVRAYRRLEYLLERRYRARRTGETPRDYVSSLRRVGLDDDARRVSETYERARYGDGVTRAEADEAIAVVDRLVKESTPVLGRLRRN
ncbi:transglutaminase TgpA family protein [Halopelagius fulvigenes]|uniref:TransglutaminaseTgpA domain-containing protein n=1 Tax=Halopelagius fulvigenes TaxID=1198324 RepID=A0ABD5TTZ4_9EURY